MRFSFLLLTIAVAAAGCIQESGYVRGDPPPYAPAPPPAADASPYDAPSDPAYSSETPPPPPAGSEVASDEVFYSRLTPYGSWVWVAPYGRVWVPAVGYGWRPYYYGQWVLTDWGWTFVSDDPWGWAAYHYGRWNWGVGVGWYWIPGRVWGPAWVSWRYGGGYAAWCPLGPSGVVFGYRHPGWVAVSETHFTQPISRVAVPVRATGGIVTSTQPLTGPHATVARNGSFGPPVASVARATGQPLRPIAAGKVVHPRSAGVAPAPRVGMRSPVTARPRTSAPAAPPPRAAPRPSAPRAAPKAGGPRASGEARPQMGYAARSGGVNYGAPRASASAAPRATVPPAPSYGAGGRPAAPPSHGGYSARPHASTPHSK